MSGSVRHVLVTGSNKGIGLAICLRLLQNWPDTFVFVSSRKQANSDAAVKQLVAADSAFASRVQAVELDVCSDASVSSAAAAVAAALGGKKLFAIINNAGVGGFAGQSVEGFDAIVGANFLGAHRVITAFLPHLRPAGGRIVQVSSGSAPMHVQKCTRERLEFYRTPTTFAAMTALVAAARDAYGAADPAAASAALGLPSVLSEAFAYGFSKALMTLDAISLAKDHPSLFVNACTPGFIETEMTLPIAAARGMTTKELGMKTTAEGAVTPCYCAMADPITTGWFYGSDTQRSPLHKYRSPGTPAYDPAVDKD